VAAALGAGGAFALAGYTSAAESMPELHLYDGYRMMLGAALALGITGPLVWRWRRHRSLPVVIAASVVGSWAPLVLLAWQRHVGIVGRLEGAWFLMGADVVGTAIPVGVACLWFALRPPDAGVSPAVALRPHSSAEAMSSADRPPTPHA
jgi:hypothetical protein